MEKINNNIVDLIDVEPHHLEMVQSVLSRHVPYKVVWAYGSRVKWTATERSDLDIVVFSASDRELGNLKDAFDESEIPFIVQVLNWESIPDDFKENIKQKYYIMQTEKSWRTCTLGDVALSANTGLDAIKRAPIVEHDTGKKCLRIQDISQNKKFENWGFTDVEDKNYEKFQLRKEDIIIARTGATIGVNKFIDADLNSVFNNGLIRIKVDRDIGYSKYIYYILRSNNYLGFIENISGGTSTQPNMQINVLLSYEIQLPPLPEQKAIGEVLSSLGDKIDLLHRQNKTLESLAETLFCHHFIENAQDDWEEKQLDEIADIGIGRTPPRKEFEWFSKNSDDVKWISIKDLGEQGVFIFNTAEYLTQEAVEKFRIPIIPQDTVVLSFKMTLGRVGVTSEAMLSNEAIAHFKIKDENLICKEFLYVFLKKIQYETLGTTSSIVTSINSGMIKELPVVIPDLDNMVKFKEQSQQFFNKIRENQKQIQTLEKLRETLLPKLISGDVRVEYGEVA